jgi:serine/threonine-protein kinase
MGTVYRAVDCNTGETVAVKALAPALSLDEHFRLRFESEIETMTRMDHPNIVRILGYGQDEGNLYFAMELVEGKSLFMLQRDGVLFDWRQVLRIALDVCAGLQHAHNRGIIHRDLKPGNLIREESGNVKITDFGIAKSFGGTQLTGEGSVLGTMDYMAPEQAQGGTVTPRSDLYSLGAVMYMLLSRRPPLKAETLEESIRNLTSVRPENITKVVPGVPAEFAAVIQRLLEKDPQKRFGTSLALSKHLIELQAELRDTAEAKTETGGDDFVTREIVVGDATPSSDFTVDPRATKSPFTAPQAHPVTRGRSAIKTAAENSATWVQTAEEIPLGPPATDFFSTVQRAKVAERDAAVETEGRSGFWLLALAFLTVVAVLGAGLYWALRRPTAEALLAEIDAGIATPTRIQEPIAKFLRYYPEHDRAPQILQVSQVADAQRMRNSLVQRSRLGSSNITALETQFLDLTDFNSPGDYKKLRAMITVLEADPDPDPVAKRLLAAARAFVVKFRLDVDRQKSQGRERIQDALDSCQDIDAGTARDICESIVELYDDQPWAQDLVSQARERLSELVFPHE